MQSFTPEFSFAGFTFPRYVATLTIGADALRRKRESRKVCGPYYHAPTPNDNRGRGFYLADAGQPAPRWEFTGAEYYCDNHADQTIRGIILRLPHGRFLAGYSMGEHMASGVGATLYTDEDEARDAADEEARIAAERQRDREAEMEAEMEDEE